MILNPKVSIPKNLNLEKPILIISNHNSRIDPFLLVLLPFALISKLIPIYFPTADKYHKNIFLSLLIRPLGSYPIKRWGWSFEDIFEKTLKDLRKGNTTLIFPEGQIVRSGEKIKAKPGFLHLASTTNSTILPIKIINKDKKTIIKIGKIKKKKYKKQDYKKEAQKIMKNLYRM